MPDLPRHAFREGPNGRCAADLGEHGLCGYGRDAAIHVEGMEHRYPEAAQPDVDQSEVTVRRAVPLRPTKEGRRKSVPWSELPLPSKIVGVVVGIGVAHVFASFIVWVCSVFLRAAGVIG